MVDLFIIAIYFVLILWIGLKSGSKISNIKEFSVGNRSFSIPVLVAALSGTLIGGGGTFGLAEKVFSSGLIFFVAYCGILIERVLTSTLIAGRIKPFFGMITAGDIMEKLYGKPAKIITGIATIATSIFILGAHITTTGFIFESFTGIPLNIGLMISTLAILIYSAYGGVTAVSFTDVIQFCFMLVSIPIVAFITLADVGGFTGIIEAVPKTHLNIFELDGDSIWRHSTIFLSYSLPALYPVVIQRMLMAKNVRQIKISLYFNTLLSAFYFAVIALIGLLAFTKDPGLNAQHAFPFLIQNTMPLGIKGLIIVGLLATVMSTVDSFLNLIGVSFTNDVLQPLSKFPFSQKQLLIIARATMVFISLAGLISAIYFDGILENVFASMNLWLPFIFPPLFLGIRCNRGSSASFFAGVIAAGSILLLTKILGASLGFFPTLISAMANCLTVYFWPKLATSPRSINIEHRSSRIWQPSFTWLRNISAEIKAHTTRYLRISDTLGLLIFALTILPMLTTAGSGQWIDPTSTAICVIVSCLSVAFILKDLWIDRINQPLLVTFGLLSLLMGSQIIKPFISLYCNNFSFLALANFIVGIAVICLFFGSVLGSALVASGIGISLGLLPLFSQSFAQTSQLYQVVEISLRLLVLIFFAINFRKQDKALIDNFLNLNGIMAHEVGHSIVSMNFCAKRLRNTLPVLIDCYRHHVNSSPNVALISDQNIIALQNLVERLTQNANRTKDTIQIIQTGIESNIQLDRHIEDFSARDTVLEAFNSGALGANKIGFKISAEDFYISAKRGPVVHVFINIFKNAIQALKSADDPQIEAQLISESCTIKIIDNGPGILPAMQNRIFESGFTTKPDGKGKGLAFCSLIMKSLGGSISVQSIPGQTIFSLEFPHPNKRSI